MSLRLLISQQWKYEWALSVSHMMYQRVLSDFLLTLLHTDLGFSLSVTLNMQENSEEPTAVQKCNRLRTCVSYQYITLSENLGWPHF